VSFFRTAPTRRLLVVLGAAAAALVVGVAIALAARGSGPTPPAKPLGTAVHDAVTAPAPDGIRADITFTNNLLPTSTLMGQAASALISGATGRLWLTNDGRGRLELQSDAGDVQIVWNESLVTIYDASSNTVYELKLPAPSGSAGKDTHAPPTLDQITKALAQAGTYWAIGDAAPTDVGGQPAYDVRVTPKTSAGLLGAAEVAWDAVHGVPLKVALYARGSSAPALSLTAKNVSFGSVPASDVDVSPPAGAKVVDIPTSAGSGSRGSTSVTGLAAVQAALPFHVAAPASLQGLARTQVRLVGHGDNQAALVVYGEGLGAVAVLERAAGSGRAAGPLDLLPGVKVGSATGHELATSLGTIVTWRAGGVAYVLAGSVKAAAAEADAAAVK
jgi:outer membrane lipoprotein-sorting protein